MYNNQTNEAVKMLDEYYSLPVDNKEDWWVRFPKRALDEIIRMEENTNAELFVHYNQLIWEETIENNFGEVFKFSIETQPNHPFTPPKVFLLHADSNVQAHRWGDRSLCLFKPEAYNSNMSVLQIRNLACSWAFCATAYENNGGEWVGAEAEH